MNKIPSDDEFVKASKYMDEQSRNLDKVCDKVIHHFKNICPLHDFYLLDQIDVDFRAYVFFKEDKDILECQRNGIIQDIMDIVYAELEIAGRGKREDITVAFEFDSDENVTANFGGDYFIRLR
jgi:hypothetical protein